MKGWQTMEILIVIYFAKLASIGTFVVKTGMTEAMALVKEFAVMGSPSPPTSLSDLS